MTTPDNDRYLTWTPCRGCRDTGLDDQPCHRCITRNVTDEVAALRAELNIKRELAAYRGDDTADDLLRKQREQIQTLRLSEMSLRAELAETMEARDLERGMAERAEAEVERMRPVVDAAQRWRDYRTDDPREAVAAQDGLGHAVDAFRAAQQEATDA